MPTSAAPHHLSARKLPTRNGDRPGGYGKIDLYVSRWKDGRWSPARNLGPAVNGPDHEFCPQIVDGGRLLLFSRDTPEGGVFQIDAAVLDDPAAP